MLFRGLKYFSPTINNSYGVDANILFNRPLLLFRICVCAITVLPYLRDIKLSRFTAVPQKVIDAVLSDGTTSNVTNKCFHTMKSLFHHINKNNR